MRRVNGTVDDMHMLSQAIKRADRRTLSAVVTHLSGVVDIIRDPYDREALEKIALEVLPPFVAGERPVSPPSEQILHAAMSLAAGGAVVPPEYGPFVREQMGLGPSADEPPIKGKADVPSIVIIGAGASGLAMGVRLDRMGLHDFTILDMNPSVGGTWWKNRYPGCRVDTPSILYSFTFDPDPGWPDYYSFQSAVLDYMKRQADAIGERIRTAVAVDRLVWSDQKRQWRISVRLSDGSSSDIQADVVIAATGFFNSPRFPDIPGREVFRGASFHSSCWDSSVDLAGKSVAVMGAGASANQIVPAIAEQAAKIVVYQRTPHWVMPHPFYAKALDHIERWLLDRVPTYRSWFRFRQFWVVGDGPMKSMRIDPQWPGHPLSINQENEALRVRLTEFINEELEGRPDLIATQLPSFPPYAKRMVIDNGWYKAIRLPHVELITDAVEELTATGIRSAHGTRDFDVIIFATGFNTNHVLPGIGIIGRNGVDVRKRLDTFPQALLGMALEDCPNFFMMNGPNGVPVHGGAHTLVAECNSSYIAECIRHMVKGNWATMEVRSNALKEFSARMVTENAGYVWSTPGVENWYGGRGRPSVVLPWRLVDLWRECKSPDFSAFEMGKKLASEPGHDGDPRKINSGDL